jgi:zinc D-Ala-D-Ala carboxypeptidase
MTLYTRFADATWDADRWPHFSARELACRCRRHCQGEYWHDPAFLDRLETLRAAMSAPLRISSGRRCAVHNAEVGGAPLSRHSLAIAADIALDGHDPAQLARAARAAGFTGIGFGRTFLHVDARVRPARWHYPGGRAAWIRRLGVDPVISEDW